MRSIWKKAALCAVALVAAGIGAGSARAQSAPFNFATYSSLSSGNYRYDSVLNQFFSTSNNSVATSIPVLFNYSISTLYGPAFTPIPAMLTFQSMGGATVDGENALPLSGVNMSITANSPGSRGSNLLSLVDSTGRIRGTNDSNSIPVSGDSSLGNTVTFTSDYLDFSDETIARKVFSLSTSDSSPSYSVDPVTNRPRSFGGTFSGSFSSAPAPNAFTVPEVNTGVLAGFVLPLVGLMIARRRK